MHILHALVLYNLKFCEPTSLKYGYDLFLGRAQVPQASVTACSHSTTQTMLTSSYKVAPQLSDGGRNNRQDVDIQFAKYWY